MVAVCFRQWLVQQVAPNDWEAMTTSFSDAKCAMSLSIDSRYITGIYALGQWFQVKKGTVDVDAFEFTNWEEEDPHDGNIWNVLHTNYQLGYLYPAVDGVRGRYREDSQGYYAPPTGHTGICFVDATTNERISFSLMEVRAFREVRS